MQDMIIVMMHNTPATVEQLHATEQSCIEKLIIVNNIYMVTIVG